MADVQGICLSPLEAHIAQVFSAPGGCLSDVRLGSMQFGQMMARVAAGFEAIKENHASEIAALRKGFEEETRRLSQGQEEDVRRKESRWTIDQDPDSENCMRQVGPSDDPIMQQDQENVCEGAPGGSLRAGSEALSKGAVSGRDLHCGSCEIAGTCKRAWEKMEADSTDDFVTSQLLSLVHSPGNELADDSLEQIHTVSFSGQSGLFSEEEQENRPGDQVCSRGLNSSCLGEIQWSGEVDREEADRESELLYLSLQPEGEIDESESAEWRREAVLAKQRFESSMAASKGESKEQKPKVCLTAECRKRPHSGGFSPSNCPKPPINSPTPPVDCPKPPVTFPNHPVGCPKAPIGCPPPPLTPSPLLERPTHAADAFIDTHSFPEQNPSFEAPNFLFPRVKRARTRRPSAALQAAILALPCPDLSTDSQIPGIETEQRQPFVLKQLQRNSHNSFPDKPPPLPRHFPKPPVSSPSRFSDQPFSSPGNFSAADLFADASVKKYWVFCKAKFGKNGPGFSGTLCVLSGGRAVIVCECRGCLANHGFPGRPMSPVEFEAHAGRASNKKWRQSIWVRLPPVGPGRDPRETTVEQCSELFGGKHLVSVTSASSVPFAPRQGNVVKTSSQAHRQALRRNCTRSSKPYA